ncbi:MAG: hypothetical protein EA409_05890 [Saprospirales bacterium]|nr:MAG: hypothetical protein EA409_05890 [Saprospirales bacterium]
MDFWGKLIKLMQNELNAGARWYTQCKAAMLPIWDTRSFSRKPFSKNRKTNKLSNKNKVMIWQIT